MKARIHVTLKPGILDPQGKAVEHALATLGYKAVSNVRIGKHIELTLDDAVPDVDAQLRAMCEKLLANTIIEEYAYELESDRALPMAEPVPAPVQFVVPDEEPVVPDADEEPTPVPQVSARGEPGPDPKELAEARQLAKRILSELASLNPKAFDEGIKQGTFRQTLKVDLDEGLRLFRQQVPESIRTRHDCFGDAVDEFILERQRGLGMR